jgi:hypothetical protein
MVEPQPSKLVVRVRFPSPAPDRSPFSSQDAADGPLSAMTASQPWHPSLCELTSIRISGDYEDPAEAPLRRASARISAPSLIVRTASASPCLESPERVDAVWDGRVELPTGRARAAEVGAVSPAGASTIVASIFKSGMPSKRARIQASTRTPSERRFPGSGTAVSPAGTVVLDDLGIAQVRHLCRSGIMTLRCAAGAMRCRRFRP